MSGAKTTAKFAGFDGFSLKVAAIAGMTCNHMANVFAATLPQPLLLVLFSLGGLTFPIMAFLLVEGYSYTSNVRRYAARLAIFACVAQIPYSLLWGAVPNVLFTLLAGLGVLWLHDRLGRGPLFLLALMAAALLTLPFDWGCIGVLLVFLFQVIAGRNTAARTKGKGVFLRGVFAAMLVPYLAIGLPPLLELPGALAGGAWAAETSASTADSLGNDAVQFAADTATTLVPFSLDDLIAGDASPHSTNTIAEAGHLNTLWGNIGYAFIGFTAAAMLIGLYNGQRGRPLKWLFYGFYPAHLLIIWALKVFCVN